MSHPSALSQFEAQLSAALTYCHSLGRSTLTKGERRFFNPLMEAFDSTRAGGRGPWHRPDLVTALAECPENVALRVLKLLGQLREFVDPDPVIQVRWKRKLDNAMAHRYRNGYLVREAMAGVTSTTVPVGETTKDMVQHLGRLMVDVNVMAQEIENVIRHAGHRSLGDYLASIGKREEFTMATSNIRARLRRKRRKSAPVLMQESIPA